MALPPKWYQFLVAVFASLGSLLYGYDLGVIAEVIASGNFKSKFGDDPNATYVPHPFLYFNIANSLVEVR
jgi:hypothetical protein